VSNKRLPARGRANPPVVAEKLQKLLAGVGLGSRREVEGWIAAGRVAVNGEVAHLGQRATSADRIQVDGTNVSLRQSPAPQVIVLNKRKGVVCSRKDEEGRPTVFDELPRLRSGRWVSIGRLDMQTTGLLLVTSDGALAHKMMHPSTGLDREYAVRINLQLEDQQIEQLRAGVIVEGERLRFSDIRFYDGSSRNFWYHVVLMEGKNREVRRLFESAGATVSRLKRVRYGPVILPSWLKERQWAYLSAEDQSALYGLLKLPYAAPKQAPTRRGGHVAKASCLLPYPELAARR
jgi:23S rRNA pseudouridine2605 synthase